MISSTITVRIGTRMVSQVEDKPIGIVSDAEMMKFVYVQKIRLGGHKEGI